MRQLDHSLPIIIKTNAKNECKKKTYLLLF